jgi:hypothetical protein
VKKKMVGVVKILFLLYRGRQTCITVFCGTALCSLVEVTDIPEELAASIIKAMSNQGHDDRNSKHL